MGVFGNASSIAKARFPVKDAPTPQPRSPPTNNEPSATANMKFACLLAKAIELALKVLKGLRCQGVEDKRRGKGHAAACRGAAVGAIGAADGRNFAGGSGEVSEERRGPAVVGRGLGALPRRQRRVDVLHLIREG